MTTASASNMLKKLDGLGYVDQVPRHGVALTDAGRQAALEVIRHHRLLETYLATRLGMPWDEVHREAEVLEHHVSEALADRIAEALGHPERDPHGHPSRRAPASCRACPSRRLSEMAEGARPSSAGWTTATTPSRASSPSAAWCRRPTSRCLRTRRSGDPSRYGWVSGWSTCPPAAAHAVHVE